LEFCRNTRYPGLETLIRELEDFRRKNSLGAIFVRALVSQILSQHMVENARFAVRGDELVSEQVRVLDNMTSAVRLMRSVRSGREPKYYEGIAKEQLSVAVGTAIAIVGQAGVLSTELNKARESFTKAAKRLGALNWSAPRDRALTKDGGAWLWWAEQRAVRRASSEPSPVWLAAQVWLSPKDSQFWPLIRVYPASIPKRFLEHWSNRRRLPFSAEPGWLYEVFVGRPSMARLLARSKDVGTEVRKALRVPEGFVTLDGWAEWTTQRRSVVSCEGEFDPRLSEWTALDLVSQILERLVNWSPEHPPLELATLHPSQFLVPSNWCNAPETPLTWEEWRDQIRKSSKPQVQIRQISIQDSRITPAWNVKVQKDLNWRSIRGIGWILLGLLRGSFRLPPAWNSLRSTFGWGSLVSSLAREVKCSSLTSGILEACLLSRARENILLLSLFKPGGRLEPDTRYEPPMITDSSDLLVRVEEAKRALKRHQITISSHRPRQLVPLDLLQISRGALDDAERQA
jgi:hypothetical protein